MTPVPERCSAVVGFVGPSGVGKTTLLERLIPVLSRRGLAVGAVKHASHGFLADRPGKDSYRFYDSGAEAVALISRQQVATFTRRESGLAGEVSLAGVLETLPSGLDLVLAEGFSWEPIPRVLLVPEGERPPQEHIEYGEVIGVVRTPFAPRGEKPVFSEALIESIADAVTARARRTRGTRPVAGEARRSAAALDQRSA
ncbi:molybdopterin-guanine dinucleotide biosynthesis protein B [bacterium]|nr:molybdopterin-guanine dinucleotide biosynthesis protein B [bacterium]